MTGIYDLLTTLSPASIYHSYSGWTSHTFINSEEAENDLRMDRAQFVQQRELMASLPADIRKHIVHLGDNAQVKGFEDLFIFLDRSPTADNLRQMVVHYFNKSPSLRGHLSKPHMIGPVGHTNNYLHGSFAPNSTEHPPPPFPDVLAKMLNPAPAISYDSNEHASCFAGTCSELLSGIHHWVGAEGQSIYILRGVAGSGKSTVAKTVAERAALDSTLGASFFFSRDEDSRKLVKMFFPTLAYQLSHRYPALAVPIKNAIEGDPELTRRALREQFHRLIVQPLQTLREEQILIVIDALDQCEKHDVETILSLFMKQSPLIPKFRVFITARPEAHIRAVSKQYRDHKQFHLHDIDKFIIDAHILSYLDLRMSIDEVQKALPNLPSPIWQPTEEEKDALAEMSGKLFIIAATAVDFILDSKRANPAMQLTILLDGVSQKGVDRLYTEIIRAARPGRIDGWVYRFTVCVGTIVLLQDPLPCNAVAKLIGCDVDVVTKTLSDLRLLLAPRGNNQIICVHLPSFPDFITDRTCCKEVLQFHIDQAAHHLRIAKCCLRLMGNLLLQPNLCGLGRNEWYPDQARILNHIWEAVPPCLAYACTYWVSHLVQAVEGGAKWDSEVKRLVERFAYEHLLMWLEALSVIGRTDVAYPSLFAVCTIRWKTHSADILSAAISPFRRTHDPLDPIVKKMFSDGCRFIQRNLGILRAFPMEIYHSALSFVPRGSTLFRTYNKLHTNTSVVNVTCGWETTWTPAIAVLQGHSGWVRSAAFSADGSRLASASDDHTVRLWDGKTARNVILKGHTGFVKFVTFSKDGTRLASASSDSTIRLWGGRTGHHITTLAGHSSAVNSLTFLPDDSRLVSASSDGTVRLWDSRAGCLITTLQGHSGPVISVACSPNTSVLVSASDATIRLWNSETGHCTKVLESHTGYVNSIAVSPDGSRLASASSDKVVLLWDVRTGRAKTLRGHSGGVKSVAFSTDGLRLASASDDKTVRLWHGRTGDYIAAFKGHSYAVLCVAFSPDGLRLVSASADKTARVWDSSICSHVASPNSHSSPVNSVAFSSNGSKFVSASEDKTVRVWDGKTGTYVGTLKGHSDSVTSVAFPADGSRLASASRDRTVRLWEGRMGRGASVLKGHSESVTSITFSADGSRLASASDDRTVQLWDGRTSSHIATLGPHSHEAISVAFSPDNSILSSASGDGIVRLWDGGTGNQIVTLKEGSSRVRSVAFSNNGAMLASASDDERVRLWDGRTGAHIATLHQHSARVTSATFSADGSRLVSRSEDDTVLLWDISNTARPRVLCKKTAVDLFYLDGRNCLFLLETRTNPVLCGLTALDIGDGSPFNTQVVCWFPPDLFPRSLVVHPEASTAAMLCNDGHLILLDISKASIS